MRADFRRINKNAEFFLVEMLLVYLNLNAGGFLLFFMLRIGGYLWPVSFFLLNLILTAAWGIFSGIVMVKGFNNIRWQYKIIGFIPIPLGVLSIAFISYIAALC
jgi:hypothetical protein